MQKEAAQFADHTKEYERGTLAQRRAIAHAYVRCLKRTVGNGLGKLHGAGCEGLTVCVGLIVFGKLGTEREERISGSIPL